MRRRSWVFLLLCLLLVSLLSQLSSANTTLRVNEASTRMLLEDKQTNLSLVIENPTGQSFPAHVRLEVLDPDDKLVAVVESDENIRRGNAALVIPLPLQLAGLRGSDGKEVLWYRLRYRITPVSASGGPHTEPIEGILSLSEITPDIFQMNVVAPASAREGTRYRAQVRTVHPITSRPVKGVRVEAEMEFDGDNNIEDLKTSSVTDANGYAALDFDLPRKIENEDQLDLEVVAHRGLFTQEADTDIDVDRTSQIFISTDKPLYQPGQVLHVRALVFDSQKRALADAKATLQIRDPEDQTAFSAELKTSRFGIASADWTIPDQLRLGDYNVRVEIDRGDDESQAYTVVKISRYELPNFTVSAKPDRPYYLPGQNAVVEVRADYLFGQPVKRGHIRLVRETDRQWNYREQKWDADEGEKYEGEADETGKFTAQINLSEEHNALQKEDYSRYRDLSYAAYFTDPTTNRTEQRRLGLRLTKTAIHVYVIEDESRQTRDLPFQFYLSTYYADGAPAQCEVAISEGITQTNPTGTSLSFYEQPLRTIRTNRYGVAKVRNLAPAKKPDGSDATLTFLAHDSKGASGRQTNTLWLSEGPVIRLETDKTLYRVGEPVRVEIAASEPEMKVVVDVWQGASVLSSQVIRLKEGRASFTIPYNKSFKDSVKITAYSYFHLDSESRYNIPSTERMVLYPRERDLKLDVRLDQSTYKPGEEAHADFIVRAPDGRAIESALGVVVFDKAVEERARTDNEFGSNYGFYDAYRSLSGYEGELSGLTGRDFFKLDLSRPVPEGMELVAEIMFRGSNFTPNIVSSGGYSLDQRGIFSKLIDRQVKPIEEALGARYSSKMEYAGDEASLRRLLDEAGVDFNQQRDPWGMPYRASFNIERETDVLRIASAGADKRFDTDDDFIVRRMSWPYFRPLGEALNRTVEQYHKRTGGYIHDAATVQNELQGTGGVDFAALRDRWGKPYALEFGTSGTNFTVAVRSGGPNGRFETGRETSPDDFTVWTTFADYFFEKRTEISSSLADHLRLTGRFPQNEKELLALRENSEINLDALRDPWGRNYYVAFSNDPRYATGFSIRTYSTYDDATKKTNEISPLTQPINLIRVRSLGADGRQATDDDFDVAALSRKAIELISKGQQPANTTAVVLAGASGAIVGTIIDPMGAVVPNAAVTATHATSSATYTATSDDEGRFTLGNLPAGFYTVTFESPGFRTHVIEQVSVYSSNITRLDGTLQVGAVTEAVTVTDTSGASLNTTNATIGQSVRKVSAEYGKNAGAAQISTPRLREYFPETLVWQPLLETDTQGRAKLDFKLADNITTWKMAVIGSTMEGEFGVVEKEIRAFQPFFVEHDPPRVLTEGDEIELPVVLRNYLDKAQAVDLEIKPESWFALSGPARKRAEVPSNDSSRETFGFRAVASIREGKQRITATGSDASDAIEKPINVHPDGEERAVTISQILGDSTTLDLKIPVELINGSLRAELKVYPNLMSHVAESIEGILVRPYGCGEQTISSTYPNLMILRSSKSMGLDPSITAKARRYLEEGYKRLLNYRVASGGFSYWGGSEEANFALTAYALRFLNDARDFLEVDETVLNGSRDFLIKQQRADGSWHVSPRYGSSPDSAGESALTTSYIARTLAGVEEKSANKDSSTAPGGASAASIALRRALEYLARHINEVSDPYTLACYALAATDAGEPKGARSAITKLRALVRADEAGTVSWEGKLGTPFYGWGTAGRIETTALALQALSGYCGMQNAECGLGERESSAPQSETRIPQLIDRALLFLLRQKDRYGVWHSTQATINVLNALVAVFSKQDRNTASNALGADPRAEVVINGRPATTITIPAGHLNNPITADISSFVSAGDNQILIRRVGGAPFLASAQVVSTFYVPWSVAQMSHNQSAASSNLRLSVSYSKSQANINEEIACAVEAVGKNYGGMLLAEIGLPPGADVDRASLEQAVKNSNWSLSRYDVLPDRVIVYLWPRSGGTKFEFKFRPRFGLTAQSAASLLYDYYNPEARVVVAPTKFVVK